jgi:hypothetical protein
MSVFAVCSAAAAAGLAVAFEIGRVTEQRISGTSKVALPFQGFDWKSENAQHAARVFVGLFLVEILFLPRSWNPFSYLTNSGTSSSFLAFFVFGSWSGILAVGYGGIAASFQALNNKRKALESEKSQHETSRSEAELKLREEKLEIVKQQRANLASAAAVAGEWKNFHLTREDVNSSALIRSETEKIWSKNITQEFDKKTMHVVDNAIDMRWREVEGQGSTLEEMRKRNKEKEKQIKEQRARRAERANAQKDNLVKEKSDLLKLTDELESLKSTMDKLKEENTKKEQEKIRELKEREISLLKKEKDLEQNHNQKLEKLKQQEMTLKSREERFDSGEDQKKFQELSEKMESSKLKVGKFNEEVMMKERQKIAEFNEREMALKKREEELAKLAEAIATRPDPEQMPDYLELYEESGPEDEMDSNTVDKSVSIRLLAEREILPDSSNDETDSSANDQQDQLPINEQEEDSRVIDKCGSEKSLLDIEDDEENDDDESNASTCMLNANEDFNNAVAIDDDESTASTCLLNAVDNPEVEERNPLDSHSADDSLSYQIQQDIAAMEREGTWNDVLSTAAIGESTEEDGPSVSSPLQERPDNATGDSIPMVSTSTTNASMVSFKDAIPMSPTSGSFKDALTVAATTSDSEYMMVSNNNKPEKENGAASPKAAGKKIHKPSKKGKKSLVVSEEAGVEVIAWMEPGQFF